MSNLKLEKLIINNKKGFSSGKLIFIVAMFFGFIFIGLNFLKKPIKNESVVNIEKQNTKAVNVNLSEATKAKETLATNEIIGWQKAENSNDIFYNGGNVGVGTNSLPQVKLDVAGAIRPLGVMADSTCNQIGSQAYQLGTGKPLYCDGTVWKSLDGQNAVSINSVATQSNVPMVWSRNEKSNDIYFNGGNVGIGVNSQPKVKLDVEGAIRPLGVYADSSCGQIGSQAYQIGTGKPLYCDGSLWKTVEAQSSSARSPVPVSQAVSVNSKIIDGQISDCKGPSTASCPSGYVIVGGGFNIQNGCGCKDGDDAPSIIENRPVQNSWRVTIECAQNIAYAICLKQ